MSSFWPTFAASPATLQVLKTLHAAQEPVSFREIVYRGGIGIRSAQTVLQQLAKQQWVRRSQKGRTTRYELQRDRAEIAVVEKIFADVEALEQQARAADLKPKAKAVREYYAASTVLTAKLKIKK